MSYDAGLAAVLIALLISGTATARLMAWPFDRRAAAGGEVPAADARRFARSEPPRSAGKRTGAPLRRDPSRQVLSKRGKGQHRASLRGEPPAR